MYTEYLCSYILHVKLAEGCLALSSAEFYPFNYTPVVHPVDPFNPVNDADTLRKALNGFDADEETIINVLARRGIEQRLEIAEAFKTSYGEDLICELKSKIWGNFEDAIVALMTPLTQYYAQDLHKAISGVGTDEEAIIEILCSLSNFGIKKVSEFYERNFGNSLEADLKADTGGYFKRLCVSLLQGNRNENQTIDHANAIADAHALYEADEGICGTQESVFNSILVKRSYQQLRQIFLEYKNLAGHDIEESIRKKFSGNAKSGLLAIVKYSKSKEDYFAKCLYDSMKGIGTKDSTLIRLIVSHSEIDLGDIMKAFRKNYGKSLGSWIMEDTSGDYEKVLLTIMGYYV